MTDEDAPVVGLVRAEVAARLGRSIAAVRRLEWDRLHPIADERGVWRFDPAEVEALAATLPPLARRVVAPASEETRALARKGRLAARVFRMFARQMTLAQIVVATKQPPDVIRELYREWSMSLDEGEWNRRDAADALDDSISSRPSRSSERR